jgi:hypothetical protein
LHVCVTRQGVAQKLDSNLSTIQVHHVGVPTLPPNDQQTFPIQLSAIKLHEYIVSPALVLPSIFFTCGAQNLKYSPITYYWTVPLILDHSYLVRKLTSLKIADTKVSCV